VKCVKSEVCYLTRSNFRKFGQFTNNWK